jgi:hypothetical protein
VLVAFAILGLPLVGRPVWADDVRAADAAVVRAALKAFASEAKARDPAARIQAVRTVARIVHADVGPRLVKFARGEDDPEVRAAVFEEVLGHRAFAERVAPGLGEILRKEAELEKERIAKGDAGFRVDPRSGDADLTSEEGRARLEATERRGHMLAALLRAVEALGWDPGKAPPDLAPLLQHPSDAVVLGALSRIQAWEDWSALPAVHELLQMYPTDVSWETGAVVDLAGTNATAKATWMVRFGHPDKQRARPDVHAAIVRTISAISGETITTPERLASWLATDAVKRRVQGRRR